MCYPTLTNTSPFALNAALYDVTVLLFTAPTRLTFLLLFLTCCYFSNSQSFHYRAVFVLLRNLSTVVQSLYCCDVLPLVRNSCTFAAIVVLLHSPLIVLGSYTVSQSFSCYAVFVLLRSLPTAAQFLFCCVVFPLLRYTCATE